MAFIEVPTTTADYRVSVGPHERTLPARALSPRARALMLEYVMPNTSDPISGLASLTRQYQFHELADEAFSRGILLAFAEPLYTPSGQELVIESQQGLVVGRLTDTSNKIGESDRAIPYDKSDYKLLERARDEQAALLENDEKLALFQIRDTLVAERAFRLAGALATPGHPLSDFFEGSIQGKPAIDIAVGTNHLGIAKKLKMSQSERLSLLQKNLLVVDFMFARQDLFTIYIGASFKDEEGETMLQVVPAQV